jgi:hypothetical protein
MKVSLAQQNSHGKGNSMVTKKVEVLKLDVGCGSKKRDGFHGVDQYKMKGVDTVLDIGNVKWPWKDKTVDEINASHFIEHLTADERIHFYNESFRVLKEGCKVSIAVPHWASNRAYGDPTHQWPPVSEMSFYYLNQEWRDSQAPHTDAKWNKKGFKCNFHATWGYSFSPELGARSQEYVQFALQNYKEAAQDMIITLTKPKLE